MTVHLTCGVKIKVRRKHAEKIAILIREKKFDEIYEIRTWLLPKGWDLVTLIKISEVIAIEM